MSAPREKIDDEVEVVLRRCLQAVVDVLPPGYEMALGIANSRGTGAFGLSPGLTPDTAADLFIAPGRKLHGDIAFDKRH